MVSWDNNIVYYSIPKRTTILHYGINSHVYYCIHAEHLLIISETREIGEDGISPQHTSSDESSLELRFAGGIRIAAVE